MSKQPRVVEDLDTAHLWLAATFADWVRELTEPERDALALYKGEGYREVNGTLRGVVEMTEQVQTTVEDLDVAIARMTLPESVVVWRAIALPQLAQAPDDLVGDVIEEAAYVSTSLLRTVAVDFLQTCVDAGDGVLERITLAGGEHVAIPVHAAAPDLIHELDEAELLLARGTRLRVTADRRDQPYRTLDLEVLP